jgi:hypothetical protein
MTFAELVVPTRAAPNPMVPLRFLEATEPGSYRMCSFRPMKARTAPIMTSETAQRGALP